MRGLAEHSADLMAYGGVTALKPLLECCVLIQEKLMVQADSGDKQAGVGMAGLAAMLNRGGPEQ